MRIPQVVAVLVVVAALSACSPAQIASQVADGASDSADAAADAAAKSDVATAKTAVIAATVMDPSAVPTDDALASVAFPPTATMHFTTADAFCVEVESASGTVFKAGVDSSVVEGSCEQGTDY